MTELFTDDKSTAGTVDMLVDAGNPPKGIVGLGTIECPFIFPDNRIELTDQDVQAILAYMEFCFINSNKGVYSRKSASKSKGLGACTCL